MLYRRHSQPQPRAVIKLLGLPRLLFPITGLTLGWPESAAAPRPRLPQPAILHWEGYRGDGQDAILHEYDQTMIATGSYENRQVPVPGRPDEMEQYGWLEHSARRVSQPQRGELRAVLSEQGFDLQ